ncbi:MAG: DNA methyltransferase [Cyanobacteriota bacterium]|nr:DNA methyltransferase [Cyanobacteriota bacterium]
MKLSPTQLNLFQSTEPVGHKLSTNALSSQNRVQRWANFIAGYSIEFVESCLEKVEPSQGLVIDPFLGCGSTLVAAKNLGFRGVGYDRHPVFSSLAKSKFENYTVEDIKNVKENFLTASASLSWSPDAEKFLRKLFRDSDLSCISRASHYVKYCPDERIKFLAIAYFLKACEAACGSQTDGIYKAPTSRKKSIPFDEAIDKTESLFLDDIQSQWYRQHWIKQPQQICINESSVKMSYLDNDSAISCITSPPYLNNFDYAEMTRMHLYLLSWAGSWRDISTLVRNHLITNTTTALKDKKRSDFQNKCKKFIVQPLLQGLEPIVAELQEVQQMRAGEKKYHFLIYPYYAEISKVLQEIYRILKKNGTINWIVADAALYGVHIKTHLHTAEIMHSTGFKNITINYIRKRGHRWILNKREGTKEGLGEYHISAQK